MTGKIANNLKMILILQKLNKALPLRHANFGWKGGFGRG